MGNDLKIDALPAAWKPLVKRDGDTAKPPALDTATLERILIHGDLGQLTPSQKITYYKTVCESVGLNPMTQPFSYLVLNNREVLYAKREATEQLRFIHSVSIDPAHFTRELVEGVYVVTAPASVPSGRTDVSTGAVWIEGLKGDARANAMMRAETKAKRRVTLSICGLGMLDETEIETIPNAYVVAPDATVPQEPQPAAPPVEEARPALLPPGAVYITKVETGTGAIQGFIHHTGQEVAQGARNDGLPLYNAGLLTIATECCQQRTPVKIVTILATKSGKPYVKSISRVKAPPTDAEIDRELDQQDLARRAGDVF